MDDRPFQRVAKALADPRRFAILEVIRTEGEISCGEIVKRFPIGQSTVSHHLRVLEEAGLVRVRRTGQHGYFRARTEVVEAYAAELRRRLAEPAPRSGARGRCR